MPPVSREAKARTITGMVMRVAAVPVSLIVCSRTVFVAEPEMQMMSVAGAAGARFQNAAE